METGSPNKYFDGLAAGKLIIVNFGGWIKSEIENAQCGIYADSRNPTDLVTKIEPFLSDTTRLKQHQQASRLLAESRYARKILGEKFANILRANL